MITEDGRPPPKNEKACLPAGFFASMSVHPETTKSPRSYQQQDAEQPLESAWRDYQRAIALHQQTGEFEHRLQAEAALNRWRALDPRFRPPAPAPSNVIQFKRRVRGERAA